MQCVRRQPHRTSILLVCLLVPQAGQLWLRKVSYLPAHEAGGPEPGLSWGCGRRGKDPSPKPHPSLSPSLATRWPSLVELTPASTGIS